MDGKGAFGGGKVQSRRACLAGPPYERLGCVWREPGCTAGVQSASCLPRQSPSAERFCASLKGWPYIYFTRGAQQSVL